MRKGSFTTRQLLIVVMGAIVAGTLGILLAGTLPEVVDRAIEQAFS